jgi:hypothetical protein
VVLMTIVIACHSELTNPNERTPRKLLVWTLVNPNGRASFQLAWLRRAQAGSMRYSRGFVERKLSVFSRG